MMKKKLVVFVLLVYQFFAFAQSPVTYQTLPSNSQINASLTGPNIIISGGQINVGKRSQIATFTNGFAAGLDMAKGVYFSTGIAEEDLNRKNTGAGYTNVIGTSYSDTDLIQVDPNATNDVISYEFSITLSNSTTGLNIAYQFASEEYPDYVGSVYNDAFGFFVKGPGINGTQNLAKLPNGKPTSVNTINSGIRGINGIGAYGSPLFDGSQSNNYLRNGHTTQTTSTGGTPHYTENPGVQPGPFPLFIEHNGATKLINYSIRNLIPGGTYTFKIIIADSSDGQLDSGVFIKDISAFMEIDAQDDSFIFPQGNNITSTVFQNDKIGGLTPTSSNALITSHNLPAGFTLNPDGTINISSTVTAGSYHFNYTLCEKSNPIFCASAQVNITVLAPAICYRPAIMVGNVLDSQHGITSLGRAGSADNDNWPMVRKGAHTVIESKSKGFVINRLRTSQKNNLTPTLGMTVFDTDLDCLSIFDGSEWKCYNTQTCPN